MKKRFVAFLLVLIMVLGMLPVSAMAAPSSNETQTIKYQILYVGDEFYTGYNYGVSVNKTYTCQYGEGHSGYNHSILISEFKNVGVPALKDQLDSGYEFVGWAKEAKKNPRIFGFDTAGTTATQTTYTIYLVAKKPAAPQVTYVLNYDDSVDDNSVTNMPASQSEKNNKGKAKFAVSTLVPVREGYTFKGWQTSDGTKVGTTVEVTNVNNPMTIYAVWEQKQHEHYDDDGDGFCDDDHTCMHEKDSDGYCTVSGCNHPDSCCPKPEDPKPPKPGKPGEDDFEKAGLVSVECSTKPADHAEETYDLGNGTFTIGEVEGNPTDGYTCEITVTANSYVARYAATHGAHTLTGDNTEEFTLTWVSGKWVAKEGGVKFYVKCDNTQPSDPGEKKPVIENDLQVLVTCKSGSTNHSTLASKAYNLNGLYDDQPGKEGTTGAYTYTITLKKDEFIKLFDADTGKTHTTDDELIPITWEWKDGAWALKANGDYAATINCECSAAEDKPTPDIYLFVQPVDSQGVKLVYKDTSIKQNVGRELNAATLARAGFTASKFGGYNDSNKEWITVGKMTTTLPLLTYPKVTDITETWLNAVKGELKPDTYTPHADAEDFKANISQAIWTKLQYMPANYSHRGYDELGKCEGYHLDGLLTFYHTAFENGLPNDSTETVGNMPVNNYPEKQIYDYYITGGTVTMPDAPTRDGYTFLGWKAQEIDNDGAVAYANRGSELYQPGQTYDGIRKDVVFTAQWEAKKANVHIMIFKSNDLVNPIVNTKYTTDAVDGDTLDLTALDPKTYLKFDFEIDGGWYDDGRFNQYTDYVNGEQENKPAELTKLQINGNWQNLKLIVTELVPVVYFDSLESLTAYQNDHSKKEGILHTTKARVGSALPTAYAPTATREGYTFTFWSREGQTGDVTGQTVNGWTNLYANWEKKTYKVVAKLYVNGKPAYYQNKDFYTYEVSGLYGENIDFDTIKAKAVEQAKQIKKASASYTAVILEDHEPNPVCTTYGEHQPGQATHYVKVNVKTEENVVIFQSFEGKTDLTKLRTTTAPYGTNVVEFLNGLDLDLDVAGYTLDMDEDGNPKWYKKDSPEWTFGTNDTINGWTNVLLKYTRKNFTLVAALKLNGEFLNAVGKDYPWSYRDTQPYETNVDFADFEAEAMKRINIAEDGKNPSKIDLKMVRAGESEIAIARPAQYGVGTYDETNKDATILYWKSNDRSDVWFIAETYYNVSFDTDGGSTVANLTDVKYGSTIELPTTTKEGYTFAGWFDEAGNEFTSESTITRETKLTAHWTANKYTVTFDANGGEGTMADQTFTYDVEQALNANAFTKTGYTFAGWKDGSGNSYTDGQTVKNLATEGTVTLTAHWTPNKYTVTFDANGGTLTGQETKQVNFGSKYGNLSTAERAGYTFDGWFTDKDGGKQVEKSTVVKNPNDHTLYAHWTANPFLLIYHSNYNVEGMDEATSQSPQWKTDDYVTLKHIESAGFAKPGYTFAGWNTKADGSGKLFTETGAAHKVQFTAADIDEKGEAHLYAQWTANKYTVTFDANGGTGTMVDQEFTYDVEQALNENKFSRTGYTFKEWTTNADGTGDKYADKATVKNLATEGSVTLYAQWTANEYTVTFNANGGTDAEPASKTVTFDAAYGTLATTNRKGYTLVGWFTAKDGGTEVESTTVVATAGDHTLYAHWTPNTYNYEIHYYVQQPDGNYVEDASALDTTKTGTFDSTVTVTPDANKYGAHFSVNNTKSKLSGVVTVDTPAEILKLEVYYARDRHTLTYLDSKGGSVIGTTTELCGVSVAAPKDPTKAGYWFDGWYNAADNKKVTFPVTLTNDMTVYAGWTMIVLPSTIAKKTPKLNTADHFAYVQGYPDGTVKPAGNITRAETAAILFRLMDESSRSTYYSTRSGFRDVASGTWYNTYVATLNNAGVITDSANGYFRPNDAITRAELAAMLAAFTDTTHAANYFNDVTANYWAANAIAVCAKLGWITGYPDGSFRPDRNVTRAELMAMINRATGRAPKSADAFLPGMKTWSDNTADKWYYLDVQEATNSHSYTVRPTEIWTAITAAPNWSKYE